MKCIEYQVKVFENGDRWWFLKGELHREDGPAVEYADGSKEWYINGEPHREDGPASEYAGGSKEWFLNGELHRIDGPALEYANGNKRWFFNDKELTEAEFQQQTNSCEGKIVEIDGKKYQLKAV